MAYYEQPTRLDEHSTSTAPRKRFTMEMFVSLPDREIHINLNK